MKKSINKDTQYKFTDSVLIVNHINCNCILRVLMYASIKNILLKYFVSIHAGILISTHKTFI